MPGIKILISLLLLFPLLSRIM